MKEGNELSPKSVTIYGSDFIQARYSRLHAKLSGGDKDTPPLTSCILQLAYLF